MGLRAWQWKAGTLRGQSSKAPPALLAPLLPACHAGTSQHTTSLALPCSPPVSSLLTCTPPPPLCPLPSRRAAGEHPAVVQQLHARLGSLAQQGREDPLPAALGDAAAAAAAAAAAPPLVAGGGGGRAVMWEESPAVKASWVLGARWQPACAPCGSRACVAGTNAARSPERCCAVGQGYAASKVPAGEQAAWCRRLTVPAPLRCRAPCLSCSTSSTPAHRPWWRPALPAARQAGALWSRPWALRMPRRVWRQTGSAAG